MTRSVVLLCSAAALSAFVLAWVVSRPRTTFVVRSAALGTGFERGPLQPDALVVELGTIPVGAQAVATWRFRNVSPYSVRLVSQMAGCANCRVSATAERFRVAEFTSGRSLIVPGSGDATVEFVVRPFGDPGPKRVEVRVAAVCGERSWGWPLVANFVVEDIVRVRKAPSLGDLAAYTVELTSRESFALTAMGEQNGLVCEPLDVRCSAWVVYGRALAATPVPFVELAREAAAPIKLALR